MITIKTVSEKEGMKRKWLEDCNLMTEATLFGDDNDDEDEADGDAEVIDDDEDEAIGDNDEEDDEDEADEVMADTDYIETAQTA